MQTISDKLSKRVIKLLDDNYVRLGSSPFVDLNIEVRERIEAELELLIREGLNESDDCEAAIRSDLNELAAGIDLALSRQREINKDFLQLQKINTNLQSLIPNLALSTSLMVSTLVAAITVTLLYILKLLP